MPDYSITFFCGGDRTRTGVQTHSPKAFYMLISCIDCRRKTGKEQTDFSLSCMGLLLQAQPNATASCFCFISRRRSVVTEQPAQRGPNDYLITD